ncbi:MAG TPA: methyltransferase domain-containing protein [Bacillota bacterium]
MGFYESIAQYYDEIFPAGVDQINFLVATVGSPPRRILDVACGSGEYTLVLARLGYQVSAIDLDAAMVAKVRQKARDQGVKVEVVQGDMLQLRQAVSGDYDLIFCIGNSLVHLDGSEPIRQFLVAVRSLLHPKGVAVFQIINYDWVLAQQVNSLPTIVNNRTGLRFERNYHWDESKGRILFHTCLTVDNRVVENTIPLFPLQSSDFATSLEQAGFGRVEWFEDFQGGKFQRYHSALQVVRASPQ